MRFPGGKNLAGVYQAIINQIPPHSLYVEPFCGSAAILRLKRPAAKSIAIDLDPGALAAIGGAVPAGTELVQGDGIEWLARWGSTLPVGAFVYCDPPYLAETRASGKRYRHELTDEDHQRLLAILAYLPCLAMLSGYRSALYELLGWRRLDFPAVTRGGWKATESLWMNYPVPAALHDYRYLGRDYREREKLARRRRRWTARLVRMDPLERRAQVPGAAPIAESGGAVRTGRGHRRKRRPPSPNPEVGDKVTR